MEVCSRLAGMDISKDTWPGPIMLSNRQGVPSVMKNYNVWWFKCSYSPWEQSTKIQPRSQTVEWQHTWSAVEVQLHHQRWQRFVFGRFKWKVCFDRTVVCAACRNDIGWSTADATRWVASEIADKEFKHIGVKLGYKKELKKGWSRKSIKIYCCNKDNRQRMENGILSKSVSGFLPLFNIWRKLVAK